MAQCMWRLAVGKPQNRPFRRFQLINCHSRLYPSTPSSAKCTQGAWEHEKDNAE